MASLPELIYITWSIVINDSAEKGYQEFIDEDDPKMRGKSDDGL